MFKIYVGNLDPRVKIEHVRELFSPFAVIEDAVIATDSKTGKSKGFAIVMIRDAEIGRAAVKATQGKRLMGKTLTINEVAKKGKAGVPAAPAARQGPFGPHFNKQGGGRFGGGGGSRVGGGMRRGMNRGMRGPSASPRPFGSAGGSSLEPGTGGGGSRGPEAGGPGSTGTGHGLSSGGGVGAPRSFGMQPPRSPSTGSEPLRPRRPSDDDVRPIGDA
ncbi:MAG: RNA recognition motif domain-containing protein [Phycisphaerales bacterium]